MVAKVIVVIKEIRNYIVIILLIYKNKIKRWKALTSL